MKWLTFLLIILRTIDCFSQSDVPLTLREQFNGAYGYTIIGNTHNEFDNWQEPYPECQMLTQSSATLNLEPNQNIVGAYLYWSGIGDGGLNPTVQLNGINHTSSDTSIVYPESFSLVSYFGAFKDVTAQVLSTGNGTYTFSNLDLNSIMDIYCTHGIYFSGWYIVLIYEEIGLPSVQLNIYDGLNAISYDINSGTSSLDIDNLSIESTDDAQMTYVAWNGSPNLFYGESIAVNGNILSDALNPPDNPFNGTNSFTNSSTNWNQDIDTFNISQYVAVGDTQANITMSSIYFRFLQTIVTSIRSQLPDASVNINQVTGQEVCANRELLVECTIYNTNSNAALPIIPVAYYANGELVGTQSTVAPIPVGQSVTFTNEIVIPSTIPDTFTLEVRADFSISLNGTVAESNENNNTDSQIITFSADTVIPTFNILNTICQGETAPILPPISMNGITGAWSPSIVNTALSGTYVFTPDPNQCAAIQDLTITVMPGVMPTFNPIPSICAGSSAPTLPATSLNGITGTWSPSVINNTTSGTYFFTPDVGQCAINQPVSISVTVTTSVKPTFNPIPAFCAGSSAPTLPATSLNGITGTWSPSVINNTISGTYIFTPTGNACAEPVNLSVTVIPQQIPDFPDLSLCANDTYLLSTQSPNGIVGSWYPAVIDFTSDGSYTFTPNSGQCAAVQTIFVTINQQASTNFQWQTSAPFTDNTTITVVTDVPGNYLYQLDYGPLQSSNIFQNVNSGVHTIQVIDPNGCANPSVQNNIVIFDYPKFFTPNGDGLNETWNISNQFLDSRAQIFIFDRYGKMLTQISTSRPGWDGTSNGQPVPATDYWFTINFIYNQQNLQFKSHFSLIR
jgi:gliding motility-associated-like protein